MYPPLLGQQYAIYSCCTTFIVLDLAGLAIALFGVARIDFSARSEMKLVLLCVACAALLSGCEHIPTLAPKGEASVDRLLTQAYDQVGKMPAYSSGPEDAVPSAKLAGATVSVVWEGDADSLLRRVAQARGLSFKIYGPFPRLPLPVFVNMTDVPFEEFMRDVGHQFGQRADLVLKDAELEIRYRGPKS
jgi:hypothetical protein